MIKRIMDIVISSLLLIIVAPLLLLITGLSLKKIGNPIFFKQMRPGLKGKAFLLIKFRTMTSYNNEKGELLADSQRLMSYGKRLRALSLDELPELWNVLKGDMSLVGPRPLLMEYLPLYSQEQMRRHHVRPGITGWAQVNGRNALSWEEKFSYDLWYVDNHTLWLDVKILFLTVKAVCLRRGITAPGHASTEKFVGTIPRN
jgi:sugar transferase EpsL